MKLTKEHINILLQRGGKLWENHGKHRVYFRARTLAEYDINLWKEIYEQYGIWGDKNYIDLETGFFRGDIDHPFMDNALFHVLMIALRGGSDAPIVTPDVIKRLQALGAVNDGEFLRFKAPAVAAWAGKRLDDDQAETWELSIHIESGCYWGCGDIKLDRDFAALLVANCA